MTSYDDRPNNDPWVPPTWSPPPAARVRPPLQMPGIETRQVLLVLGAGCLVAALAAGTALVWHALGPNGQAGLMLMVTATVLVLSVRLQRLTATAQALGAVGVAGLLIDAVAGRSLELGAIRDLPLHVYAGLAASTVSVLLVALSIAVRRLWAPPIGAVIAASAAVAAWVHPSSIDGLAWFGIATAVVALLMERLLAEVGPAALVGRFVNVSLVIPMAGVGAAVSLISAARQTSGAWAGVALIVLLLTLPEVLDGIGDELESVVASTAGVLAGALLVASAQPSVADAQVAIAGVMAVTGVVAGALHVHGRGRRLLRAVQLASVTVAMVTFALLVDDAAAFVHVNAAYSLVCIAVAVAWRDALLVRGVAAAAAVPFATIAVDLQLHLDRVSTPETYVLVPAIGMVMLAAVAMLVWPATRSWVLVPGLALGLLPTVVGALDGDGSRQAAALGAGALLVVIGAQLRLAGSLCVGTGAVSLLVLRLVGPEMKRVPEWVALGVAGVVLLTLGATWEARLLDLRRAAHALRPRVAALR